MNHGHFQHTHSPQGEPTSLNELGVGVFFRFQVWNEIESKVSKKWFSYGKWYTFLSYLHIHYRKNQPSM